MNFCGPNPCIQEIKYLFFRKDDRIIRSEMPFHMQNLYIIQERRIKGSEAGAGQDLF